MVHDNFEINDQNWIYFHEFNFTVKIQVISSLEGDG